MVESRKMVKSWLEASSKNDEKRDGKGGKSEKNERPANPTGVVGAAER